MNNSNKSYRHSLRALMLCTCAAVVPCSSQTIYSDRIKDLRIHGTGQAKFPMVLLDSHPVTISFDTDGPSPDNYQVKIVHCDKDWNKTQSSFINDEFRNYSTIPIPFEIAPTGVRYYRRTYSFQLPGLTGLERMPQSGNYKIELWDQEKRELLAEAKLFAVEKIEDGALTVSNRYLQSEISPQNQVLKAVLSFTLPAPRLDDASPLLTNFIKTVDLYRNRELETPHRIDVDHRNTNTFIDGLGTNLLKFMIDNLPSGNEYRCMDLMNTDLYPPNQILRSRNGADVCRWLWQGKKDQQGTSTLITGTLYADYVQFQFELGRPEELVNENIFIVGDFNGWKVVDQWRMEYDEPLKQYTLRQWLRRGAYDYQYVLHGTDWTALEGNDWRTVSVITALLYYHDVRFGGFDRILLAAQKESPGGTQATSN